MKQGLRAAAPLRRQTVAVLFGVSLVLQCLDLHSSWQGAGRHVEQNHLIDWLATGVGTTGALLLVKVLDGLLLAALYVFWRKTSGQYDLEVALCLAITAGAYALVVANNYLIQG